ncbi:hypothetical protein CO701_05945 [Citrobacter werkmanii]|uniref:hypothetical protein n=1 Tax=Citrobacter sp. wls711 TaxID=2576425 RepID=UPI000BBD2BDE|nr:MULTISPECIES: hypothetical protein [Citrobacter]ATF48706.1 hypothetical protein CO701_05945 [Citrobacter werkmanii]TKU63488.1 hypothetical protein FDW98_08300 [Citrobacter sp. wls711]HEE0106825.1 hypothetical protein [Citrobacter gillenii]HEE0120156.1 hypothetical protein [Citrobacter gillenii]
MAKLSGKYQRAYQREYAKEAEKNALVWISQDDYLAECLDTHKQCHQGYSLQEQISSWLFMLRMKRIPDLLGFKTAIQSNNMEILHSSLLQSAMIKHATLGVDSGCDHCINIWTTLDVLAAGLFDRVPLLLPEKLGMSDNGHPVAIAMTNLMMALWYQRADFKADARKRAQKVLATKQASADVCTLRYLIALLEEDVTEAGTQLDLYCKSVSALREPGITKLHKMFWSYAHGLYNMAFIILGREQASLMQTPEADCFIDDLAEWQIKHNYRHGPLFFAYPEPIDVINTLISCTPPECSLHQPYLGTDKKYREERYLHAECFEQKMIKIILDKVVG